MHINMGMCKCMCMHMYVQLYVHVMVCLCIWVLCMKLFGNYGDCVQLYSHYTQLSMKKHKTFLQDANPSVTLHFLAVLVPFSVADGKTHSVSVFCHPLKPYFLCNSGVSRAPMKSCRDECGKTSRPKGALKHT